jgi:hypothetical protein
MNVERRGDGEERGIGRGRGSLPFPKSPRPNKTKQKIINDN